MLDVEADGLAASIIDAAGRRGLDFTPAARRLRALDSTMLEGTTVRITPRGEWTASVLVFDADGELSTRATVSAMGAEDPAAAILAVAAAMAGTARRGRGR